ncbi:hypothetical protein GCM10022286_05540 [Gryllotalpicola daejeonensis]|uniref:Uncharacterized protein n=1 Tax=Gryllotalpicola daejeonensis TaxID=993087 RepID=A0ABP7ZF80_9MICO
MASFVVTFHMRPSDYYALTQAETAAIIAEHNRQQDEAERADKKK